MGEDSRRERFLGGPRPLSALLPRLTRPAFRRRSPAGATLMAEWPALVGPALAAVTHPVRFAAGTLTIACAGPVAMELSHLAPQLIARINGQLGRADVSRLRFVQRAPQSARPVPPRPAAATLPARIDAALAGLPDADLRAALAKLGRGVYRSRE
jgi:hypothetical protein